MAKTLIVRYSQIGDVLILLPILNSLAKQYPEHEFIVLTNPKFSGIFKQMPSNVSLYSMVYRKQNIPLRGLVHLYHRYKLLVKFFLGEKYDKVAILQDGTFDVQLDKILSAKGSKVTRIDFSDFLSKKRLQNKDGLTLFKMYLNILSQLDYHNLSNEFDLSYYTAPKRQNIVLQSVGLDRKKTLIGIAPFSRIDAKMYPLDKMEKVIEYYHNHREDVQIVILGGGEQEKRKADEWKRRYPRIESLINKLSFDDEISIISAFKTVLSMDSANMHLAALVGTPVISIWGPGDPRLGFYPVNEKEEHAVQKELSCRPCSFWGEIPCVNPNTYECMDIDPQIIIDKINNMI